AYFVNPNDLIPDQTPGLGFLDDAIVAEPLPRLLAHEVEATDEFVQSREPETERRRSAGPPIDSTHAERRADRRAALHARFRSRRSSRSPLGSGGWTVKGLGF